MTPSQMIPVTLAEYQALARRVERLKSLWMNNPNPNPQRQPSKQVRRNGKRMCGF